MATKRIEGFGIGLLLLLVGFLLVGISLRIKVPWPFNGTFLWGGIFAIIGGIILIAFSIGLLERRSAR